MKTLGFLVLLTGIFYSFTGILPATRLDPTEVVLENPVPVTNLEVGYYIERHKPRLRLLQLKEGASEGYAEDYFYDPSASYDITVTYVEGSEGTGGLELLVNGDPAGKLISGSSKDIKKYTFRNIDVQERSRIGLVFSGDGKGLCRFDRLVFTPVGKFKGKLRDLEKPKAPRVFHTGAEREAGTGIMTGFVDKKMDSLMDLRRKELSSLKTPAEWQDWQRRTRARLPEFFGEFPEKTPLNPRVTGTLDRDGYVIEKVVFESQPGYYVSSNFYLPRKREFPVPGIVFTCGHAPEGRMSRLYHEACLGLVLKGYAVLAFDPMGQGERSEYVDASTGRNIIRAGQDQHMYLAWPSVLVDWSLSGTRVWDGIRAVDYLVSRPEVDSSRLGVVGNSGGGQMSFLIAAADERIDVCVAAHPGGPLENSYLTGYGQGQYNLADREVLSLIPPRPCRIVVGTESGEIERHRPKYDDLLLFYKGLGCEKKLEYTFVDGVHDMRQPKREASYEWFNRWFGKEEEGKAEPELHPEDQENLRCTESGFTLLSLGGETGQTINVKRMERMYHPTKDAGNLKQNIAARIGLSGYEGAPPTERRDAFSIENIRVEKFTYVSEPGIMVPSVLYTPAYASPEAPVILYCSDRGKPLRFGDSDLPFLLAGQGYTVLAVDARGTGETAPVPLVELGPADFTEENLLNPTHHFIMRGPQFTPANNSPAFGRTMLGMRTFDVLKGIAFIKTLDELRERKIIVAGEGSGGLWALLAAVFDPTVSGIVTLGTVPSYQLFITSPYYDVWEYFWVPGVLRDFDIPDLARLVAPRTQLWIDPMDAMGDAMEAGMTERTLGRHRGLHIETNGSRDAGNRARIIHERFPIK